ncbi:DgyrCDS8248 [Dimorphilus gyrociliatus]|uniref:DgyrCDS8248 n=1 Tax=Dimorphilus gyrociliatus TaxID=2664684 RepID=A0A7I8VTL3_9ANNE|nr:DgyrCDS8248 [Dimorphilus gyrociliatus]
MSVKELFRCIGRTEDEKRDKMISKQLKKADKREKSIIKILLLGIAESGKSTITKQMKIIHINGYSEEERRQNVLWIRKNLRDSILTILGAMKRLDIKLEDEKLEESSNYLLTKCIEDSSEYPDEFYDHTSNLWSDKGVLKCYKRSAEYQLIDCAKYFLDKIHVIRREDYLPTEQDILHCRTLTNTIQKIEFTITENKFKIPFHVFDVGGQRGERKKWIQMFDSATAILFVLDSSTFDVNVRDDFESNRLLEATGVFEHIWNCRFLKDVSILLFINKIDLLVEKIMSGSSSIESLLKTVPTSHKYYPLYEKMYKSFNDITDGERKYFVDSLSMCKTTTKTIITKKGKKQCIQPKVSEEVIKTAVFIKRVFMEIAVSSKKTKTGRDLHKDHDCQYFYTCAVDTKNIEKVLEGVRSILTKNALRKICII